MSTSKRSSKTEKMESKRSKFTGKGHRLGGFFAPTSVVKPEEVEVLIKLWNDGFSIDDGPLRGFDDPNDADFMKALKRGEIPNELEMQHKGSRIDAQVWQMKRKFPVPRPRVTFIEQKDAERVKIVPFSGKGRVLGAPSPETTPDAAQKQEAKPTVDSTSILIYFPDGCRRIASFALDGRVSDLRSFISSSQPQMKGRNFRLLTSFPRREITNSDAVLSAEGLFKAVVIVRFSDKNAILP